MINICETFGCMAFNDAAMKERLPADTYSELKRAVETGGGFAIELADAVAEAMKNWALEKGATHYTHWFQPMTGVTAEKHESFVAPIEGGGAVAEFSGRELIRGEPDASAFPSGGLRATFEARGYTAWDPSSSAFVKDGTLYIPTAFCSYSGEALDKKTPLLRSIEALNKQAKRILALFGDTNVKRVFPTSGAEQEYFLIDKAVYDKRPDLQYCGRTLFGARPAKGQDFEGHYYGAIKPRVAAFMKEADLELWKLGVPVKTKHNEAAPAQHELAVFFSAGGVAADHNQLTMDVLKCVAARHGMVCLLHEKPFAGVSGSGKHNNWSMATDAGINLLEPGGTPSKNARFLLFIAAAVKAVDEYQDILRASAANAGNDHRLGANEAPPAIVSVYLGEELTAIFEDLENGKSHKDKNNSVMEIAAALPRIPKDATDRNRTSPFAFTGNKFEFRMPGSSSSIADPNIVLNTIAADALSEFADELEKSADFNAALTRLIKNTFSKHKRIIFNGNNYSNEWVAEAGKRGLLNLKTTADALPCLIAEKNVALFSRHGVYSESELRSRLDIQLDNYCTAIKIEAMTMLDMVKKRILPGVFEYQRRLSDMMNAKSAAAHWLSTDPELDILTDISNLTEALYKKLNVLEKGINKVKSITDKIKNAEFCRDNLLKNMAALRADLDALEMLVAKDCRAAPSYGEILYSVK